MPGVTVLSEQARSALQKIERGASRAAPPSTPPPAATPVVEPAAPEAYEPPSDEVRAMMRQIEHEAAMATAAEARQQAAEARQQAAEARQQAAEPPPEDQPPA